jgi:1-acyl-sn-glycerol-3-phosphate acyltransferase
MPNKSIYAHRHWILVRKVLQFLIHQVGYRFLAKFDSVEGLEHIPAHGSGIIIYNHIAFVDPVAVLSAIPRDVVPLAKTEAMGIPFFGIFARLWGAIPIHRGEVDRDALESSFQVLEAGEILLIAPEGTRNPALIEGKDGIAYMAVRHNTPIIPAAVTGTGGFPSISRARWKKPGIRIRFGRPFRFKAPAGRVPRELMHTMTQEAMYQLAALLPPERRGVYADLSKQTTTTLEWLDTP